jgi:cyclophilin family peptidyl-prolyl cis-trans isomerase
MYRYGPGPYQVEFELDFSPDENEEPTKFVVEMAPLDLMPHAVHHFLEMISHDILDGFSFAQIADHVVVAREESDETEQALEKARLTTLTFAEYSHEFPHDAYTLGFSGAPAGPSWYINTIDNVESHGPGGQDHHQGSAGDPCFAKVVSGFSVIDRIQNRQTISEDSHDLEHDVGIQRVRILPNEQHQMRR